MSLLHPWVNNAVRRLWYKVGGAVFLATVIGAGPVGLHCKCLNTRHHYRHCHHRSFAWLYETVAAVGEVSPAHAANRKIRGCHIKAAMTPGQFAARHHPLLEVADHTRVVNASGKASGSTQASPLLFSAARSPIAKGGWAHLSHLARRHHKT